MSGWWCGRVTGCGSGSGLFFAPRFSRRSDQKVFEDERAVAGVELTVAIAAKDFVIGRGGGVSFDPDDLIGHAAVRAVEG